MNNNYQSLDIHLKRLETSRSSWTGVILKAQQDIDYHGNVVSALYESENAKDKITCSSSWNAIAIANKRMEYAKKRLAAIDLEEAELRDTASISKAKEFIREQNTNIEMDWIEEGWSYVYCTRCGETDHIDTYEEFVVIHAKCQGV